MATLRHFWAAACLSVFAAAHAQVTQETTLESYFLDTAAHQGPYHYITWGQTNVRFNNEFKATLSGLTSGGRNSFDEACLSIENNSAIVRIGRFKTAFGFSNWSENFYNGFNHLALVRLAPLADGLTLTRDDAGAELTFGGPGLQVQTAIVDTAPGPAQLGPKRADHASLRLQTNQGDFIIGLDLLASLVGTTDIVGLDARWTAPRVLVRGELMAGRGAIQSSWGYYVDAAYRIPKLTRTQAVIRLESVDYGENDQAYSEAAVADLTTVGLRQVVSPNLSVNLNYGWGTGASNAYIAGNALNGWTLRAMFQLHF
ncbi:MAG: hypothetical protein ACYC96_13620 [Fimbriimonadaceae bacterium]